MLSTVTMPQGEALKKFVSEALEALRPNHPGIRHALGSEAFQARFQQLVIDATTEYLPPFFLLLSDDEAVAWIVKHTKGSEAEARRSVERLRQEALAQGVEITTKIHREVQPGRNFKQDIPKVGPTWKDLQYLQNWKFSDPQTKHCLVSCIPKPLARSTEKSAREQEALIRSFHTKVGLPAWYKFSFGSITHIGGMSLTHFNETGESMFGGLAVRTDTFAAADCRLSLCWRKGDYLYCDPYGPSEDSVPRLAAFAVGVVEALGG